MIAVNLNGVVTRGVSHPIGATLTPEGVNFCVYSRNATHLELLLFDRVNDAHPSRVIGLDLRENRTHHYWHVFVPGLKARQIYAYRAHGPFEPHHGLRFDGGKVLLDPYGRGVAVPGQYSREAASVPGDNTRQAPKSVVIDTEGYDWGGDCPLQRRFGETIIYEMHVRGFTRHPSSGLPEERRGTYAGLIDKIPYLQERGVTAVELLPVFQYDPQDAPSGRINSQKQSNEAASNREIIHDNYEQDLRSHQTDTARLQESHDRKPLLFQRFSHPVGQHSRYIRGPGSHRARSPD